MTSNERLPVKDSGDILLINDINKSAAREESFAEFAIKWIMIHFQFLLYSDFKAWRAFLHLQWQHWQIFFYSAVAETNVQSLQYQGILILDRYGYIYVLART